MENMLGAMPESNENSQILADLKKLLPSVPVAQRGQALAIYNIMKKYCECDDASDVICKDNLKIFEDAELEITGEADAIIEGSRKCNEGELEATKEFLNDGEEVKEEDNNGEKIPGYWLKCFKNKKLDLYAGDEPILAHLIKLDVIERHEEKKEEVKKEEEVKIEAVTEEPKTEAVTEEPKKEEETTITKEDPTKEVAKCEDGCGHDHEEKDLPVKWMDVVFYFEKNEHFENEKLTLQIEYKGEDPTKSSGDKIIWKEGKNITEKKVSKKQKSKKTGKTRTVDKVVKTPSFFGMFETFTAEEFQMPEAEQIEEEGIMNIYMVSGTIEEILEMAPYSLEYYMDCHPDEEGDYSDEEDEDDDDEDDEDDEEEDEKKPKRKRSTKGKKSGKNSKKASGTNVDGEAPKEQDCKQN